MAETHIPPPPEMPEEKSGGSFLSIALALFVAAMLFVGLFFLTMGAAGPILVVSLCVFAVAGLHYFIWGWWLSKAIRDEVEEEESQ